MSTSNSQDSTIQSWIGHLGVVILNGGKSRRMGADKSSLMLGGRTFLETLIHRFRNAGMPIVVVGGKRFQPPATDAINDSEIVFADDETPNLGPLEGIRVGLARLRPHVSHAFVTGCDNPLVKLDAIRFLLEQIGSHQVIVPCIENRVHGMMAIYRTDLHSIIHGQLADGQRSVQGLIASLNAKQIQAEDLRQVDPALESLLNVNTPEEYQALLNRIGTFPS